MKKLIIIILLTAMASVASAAEWRYMPSKDPITDKSTSLVIQPTKEGWLGIQCTKYGLKVVIVPDRMYFMDEIIPVICRADNGVVLETSGRRSTSNKALFVGEDVETMLLNAKDNIIIRVDNGTHVSTMTFKIDNLHDVYDKLESDCK